MKNQKAFYLTVISISVSKNKLCRLILTPIKFLLKIELPHEIIKIDSVKKILSAV